MSTKPDTTSSDEVPKGYWRDANGNLVPVAKVKEIDKARTAVATELAEAAKKLQVQMAEFKHAAMLQVADFVSLSAAQYDVQMGGEKGNVTLVTFDGRFKVVRQVAETLAFDERLQVAKKLIDECVHLWAKGANKNVQALVNHAFQVDKTGKVATGRILALRQLQIDDPKWKQAMEAIADSMKTVSSKSFIRFYERNEATGDYLPIALDLAAL